jgi:AraC family transcriptional regulator of adaptative response/methylated-DNA-[protein]-cysteine methyltransferase
MSGTGSSDWPAGASGAARQPSLELRCALGECSLGSVLAARTPRGLWALWLGDSPEATLEALRARWPRVEFVIDPDEASRTLMARLLPALEQPADAPQRLADLPLDVPGTPLQQRVWRALRALPPGAPVSYAELARRLGVPRAVRAVAGAIAANPLAVMVPCHRVVRGDGSLAGFRWGLERKRELLRREALAAGRAT